MEHPREGRYQHELIAVSENPINKMGDYAVIFPSASDWGEAGYMYGVWEYDPGRGERLRTKWFFSNKEQALAEFDKLVAYDTKVDIALDY